MNALADYTKRISSELVLSWKYGHCYISSIFVKRHLFLIFIFFLFCCSCCSCLFVCLLLLLLLLVVVVLFFKKNGINSTVNFLQSCVNFPILNKVLLTDSLNFASKENFRVFRVFDLRAKIENSETSEILQDFTSFERINVARIVWFTKYVLGILVKRQILR